MHRRSYDLAIPKGGRDSHILCLDMSNGTYREMNRIIKTELQEAGTLRLAYAVGLIRYDASL